VTSACWNSHGEAADRRLGYLMCTPEMARLMISRWISLVPSKMVKVFEVNAYSLFRAWCGAGNPALTPCTPTEAHELLHSCAATGATAPVRHTNNGHHGRA